MKRSLIVVLSCMLISSICNAAQPIGAEGVPVDFDAALANIKRHDATRTCVTFKLVMKSRARFESPSSQELTADETTITAFDVAYCPHGNRYKISGEDLHSATVGSDARTEVSTKTLLKGEQSSNGKVVKAWRSSRVGMTEAEEMAATPYGDAMIMLLNSGKWQVQSTGFTDPLQGGAFDWVGPNIWPISEDTKPLAKFLEEKKAAGDYLSCYRVDDRDIGFHHIAQEGTVTPYETRIRYNLSAGRVEAMEWGRSELERPETWICWRRVTLEYATSEAWVPSRVLMSSLYDQTDRREWKYSDIQYYEALDDKDFDIEIPSEIAVIDYRPKLISPFRNGKIDASR